MKIEPNEEAIWGLFVVAVATVLITVTLVCNGYYRAVETAAIAKGLCQQTVPGSNQLAWTTCPVSK